MNITSIQEAERVYGGSQVVPALLARAKALREDTSLPRVAIAGSANAGKTTLLNAAVGARLREPQMLGKDLRPVRVTFARREDDPRCDCAEAFSPRWAEAVGAMYEMDLPLPPAVDADGVLGLAEDIDCWFFVLNASMPLAKSETEALSRLQTKAVTILINRLDLVKSGESDRVVQFIRGYCQKLGLADPIPLPANGDDQELGRILRGLLPDEEELARLRAGHADALTEQAGEYAAKRLREAMEENEAARQAAVEGIGADELSLQRRKVAWGAVRADLLSRGEALHGMIEKTLRDHQQELTQELMAAGAENSYSPAWCAEGLPKAAGEALRKILAGCEQSIVSQVDADVAAVLAKAADLDLTLEDLSLRASGPAEGLSGQGRLTFADIAKLAAFSVAAVGGITLFSMAGAPHVMAVAATAVAAGTFNEIYKNAKQGNWYEALYAYAGECIGRLSADIREQVSEHYLRVAKAVSQFAAEQKVGFDPAPFDGRKAVLEAALAKLEEK